MKASDYSPTKELTALFIGRSGSGKSFAMASFPKPLYDFEVDLRFDGIYSGITAGLIADSDKIEFDNYPCSPKGFIKFNEKLEEFNKYNLSGQGIPFKTLLVNSVTSFAKLAVSFSHKEQGGKKLGTFRVSGPPDYAFESSATLQLISLILANRCNIIFSAHIIDKYGKPELQVDDRGNPLNAFVPAEIIGEKLAIRDNLGENVLLYFSNVFRFDRFLSKKMVYTVEFATDIAKNAFNLPPGKFDITDKPFYPFFLEAVEAAKAGKIKLVNGFNVF